jgi:hypothetical protein
MISSPNLFTEADKEGFKYNPKVNPEMAHTESETRGQNITNEYLPKTLQSKIDQAEAGANLDNVNALQAPIRTGIAQQNADNGSLNAQTNVGRLGLSQQEFDYKKGHPTGIVPSAANAAYKSLNNALYAYTHKKVWGQPAISDNDFKAQTGYTPAEAQKVLNQMKMHGYNIPPLAISYLRQHPETASQFDAKYGTGYSRAYLGQ